MSKCLVYVLLRCCHSSILHLESHCVYADHRLVLTVAHGDVKNLISVAQSLHAANGSLVAVEVGRVELGGRAEFIYLTGEDTSTLWPGWFNNSVQ